MDKLRQYLTETSKGEDVNDLDNLHKLKGEFIGTIVREFDCYLGSFIDARIRWPSSKVPSSNQPTPCKYKDALNKRLKDPPNIPQGRIDVLLDEYYWDDPPYNSVSVAHFKTFLADNYTPPSPERPGDLSVHLMYLWIYYTHFAQDMPLALTARIDLALAKVLVAVGKQMIELERKAGRLEGGRGKKAEANKKAQYIYGIFYESKAVKPDMTLWAVVKEIHEEFGRRQKDNDRRIPSDIKRPSEDQIRRYLKKDEGIMKKFKKSGRNWVMQT